MMSPISKFTRKELGKDIQKFVLLDQVHAAVAYLNRHAVLFIIHACHFENDYVRRRSVMCTGSLLLRLLRAKLLNLLGQLLVEKCINFLFF